jgi:cobalt/nickel transport system permease protein
MLPIPLIAMHITEGILPAPWAGLWFLVALPPLAWGLRTINRRRTADAAWLPLVALVGSAVFVVSCMPVPLPVIGSCSHPCGTGLGALVIGPGPTVVVASIALVFQALFLAHGGLSTLGANIVSMGVVGAYAAFGTFHLLVRLRAKPVLAAMAAGLISDWATYAMTSFELSCGLPHDGSLGPMFLTILAAFVPTQVPLGIAEGILTGVAYRFMLVRRPELLGLPSYLQPVAGEEL